MASRLADYSGTCDGVDHQILPRNNGRMGLLVQNPTTQAGGKSFWIQFDAVAVQDSPSIEVPAGVTLTGRDLGSPSNAIHVIGDGGVKYTVKAA